jgi:hypothetical protein
VPDSPNIDQQSPLAQRLDHRLLDLVRREARERAVVRKHSAFFINGHEHGQVVYAGELEVLGPGARRDVDDPGALRQ